MIDRVVVDHGDPRITETPREEDDLLRLTDPREDAPLRPPDRLFDGGRDALRVEDRRLKNDLAWLDPERVRVDRAADERRGAGRERLILDRLDRVDREADERDRERLERRADRTADLWVERDAERLDPLRGGPAYVSATAAAAKNAARTKGR